MTDWRAQVREAVADADRDSLPADAVRAMRQTVVAVAREERGEDAALSWRRPLALAAALLLLTAVGITAGRRMNVSLPVSERPAMHDVTTDPIRPDDLGRSHRQLQFLTPGGTRIIWVFNSDLDLKAAIQ
jgi:hypothetical protein